LVIPDDAKGEEVCGGLGGFTESPGDETEPTSNVDIAEEAVPE
jgi:hypothetical protein